MTGVILLFLLGLVLMVKGGDSFVEGAEWMARVTGIPPFVVAATVVSLGTTMPELLVSTMAAAQGSGGMALGNAVGSVSCNTGLILGISLLFLPGRVTPGPCGRRERCFCWPFWRCWPSASTGVSPGGRGCFFSCCWWSS